MRNSGIFVKLIDQQVILLFIRNVYGQCKGHLPSTKNLGVFHNIYFFCFQSAGSLSGGSEDGAGQNLDYDNQADEEYHRVSNSTFLLRFSFTLKNKNNSMMSEGEFYIVGIEFLRERKVQKNYNFAKILKVYNTLYASDSIHLHQ